MVDIEAPLTHRHIYNGGKLDINIYLIDLYGVKNRRTKINISPASSDPQPWCFPGLSQVMLLHVNNLNPELRENLQQQQNLSMDVIYTLVDVSQFHCLQI